MRRKRIRLMDLYDRVVDSLDSGKPVPFAFPPSDNYTPRKSEIKEEGWTL